MFIRVPKPWLNRSVVAKSFPDCQFRFLGIVKIILKTNAFHIVECAFRPIAQSFKLCIAHHCRVENDVRKVKTIPKGGLAIRCAG